ncbi:MAG: hypothetical protein H7X99_04035 [Saprospiraceae bacterium]|nr:hypothetical protein [Saprospiraceae bacterium]
MIFTFSFIGCYDLDQETDFGLGEQEYELAVPLINSKITIGKISEESKGNTSIRFDAEGKATVLYNGEVIRRSTAAIFPPLPGILPIPIIDSISKVEIFEKEKYLVKKAIFNGTKIKFVFENALPQNVNINMRIPELSKDGKIFERDFVLIYNGSSPSRLTTEEISVDGWTLESQDNALTYHYKARLVDGSPVKLDLAQMTFDVIKFSYIDGYLGYHVFAVDGNIIDVGLFDKWKSGSFDFADPKITLSVDNGFGLPVRSQVNKMELTSITGKTVNLESEFINTGINFAYPSFSEIGLIKTTHFVFDKSNSNIREIFNEKTKNIAYDINALVNPDRDTTIKGFIAGDSYFVVRVAVEVPFLGSVNNVVICDTLDIELDDAKDILSAEFKAITSNDFPADMKVQAYFLDDTGTNIDQLFSGDGILLPAATLQTNGKTLPGTEKIDFIDFDKTRFELIRKSKKLVLVATINTTGSDQKKELWVYDHYGIGLKLGAIIKYKKN